MNKALWRGVIVAVKVIAMPVPSSPGPLNEAKILRWVYYYVWFVKLRQYDVMMLFLCSKLHHPNIIGILDVITTANGVTIIMPLVEGHSLYSLIFNSTHPRVCNCEALPWSLNQLCMIMIGVIEQV